MGKEGVLAVGHLHTSLVSGEKKVRKPEGGIPLDHTF